MPRTQAAPRPDVARATSRAVEPLTPPEWNQPQLTPDEISEILARADAAEDERAAAEDAERLTYTPPAPHLPGWINEAAEDICYHTGLLPRVVPMVAGIIARYSPLTRTPATLRSHPSAGRPPATV